MKTVSLMLMNILTSTLTHMSIRTATIIFTIRTHTHTHSHTPMDELLALMKYMVGHNASHTKELADLASRLEQAGNHDAYEKVMAAVTDFEKGNNRLADVLGELEAK